MAKPIWRFIVVRGGLSHKPGGFSRSPCQINAVNFHNIEICQINVIDDYLFKELGCCPLVRTACPDRSVRTWILPICPNCLFRQVSSHMDAAYLSELPVQTGQFAHGCCPFVQTACSDRSVHTWMPPICPNCLFRQVSSHMDAAYLSELPVQTGQFAHGCCPFVQTACPDQSVCTWMLSICPNCLSRPVSSHMDAVYLSELPVQTSQFTHGCRPFVQTACPDQSVHTWMLSICQNCLSRQVSSHKDAVLCPNCLFRQVSSHMDAVHLSKLPVQTGQFAHGCCPFVQTGCPDRSVHTWMLPICPNCLFRQVSSYMDAVHLSKLPVQTSQFAHGYCPFVQTACPDQSVRTWMLSICQNCLSRPVSSHMDAVHLSKLPVQTSQFAHGCCPFVRTACPDRSVHT